MPGVKSRGTGTEACPVTNCPFVGPSRAMTVHWRSFHEESILLYLCPLPGCSWQTPKPQGLRQHWENRHQASRQQSRELRTLPLLANFVKNKHRRDPGNSCPPVPPLQKPMGCLPHGSKGTILVQVQRILSTMRMPTPGQLSLVAPSSLPGSLPATPPVLPGEDQRAVVKDTPPLVAEDQGMAAGMGFSPAVIPVTPDRKPPTCLDSPIVIDNSPASKPVVPASVSPAFTALSTPTLSVLLSSSLSILGSPSLPPVTSPGPDQDPVLGGLSPVMREPLQPSRSLLDEFAPVTPSATLPCSTEVLRCPATACTVMGGVPSGERAGLVGKLQDIDRQRASLDVERVEVLRQLASVEGEEIQHLRQQLVETQQRCQLLESQVVRLRSSGYPTAEVVGDLEPICTSHALLLLPNRGQTTVYHLTQRDLKLLSLSERDTALSCERL